ncbi:Magnesium transporter MgtE [Caulifigura coniformis]|uniref:Magnesium transporter MgtE n=1 Tax=Caulifigura coniformis TaxID=2527983 RepID=A0A517SG26_9PLAN|nr:magnesium transporter [Caulifigura coniformis]QDT55086.1 Magnesium transporter MgtE [Caulifigura coniformis]
MMNPLLLPEIRMMLAEGDAEGMAALVNDLHPASVAEFTEGLSDEEIWALLGHGDVERQADIFSFFPEERQLELAEGVGRERMSQLLGAMSHDDRVDFLKRVDPQAVESLLPLMAKADREDIRKLLSYPEGSAGSMMTTDYATLLPDITVEEAINRLRQQATQKETIYYIYVTNEDRKLLGFVSLRHLILAKLNALVRDIMQSDVVYVRVDLDQEEVARIVGKYDFIAIPVVDNDHRIVGIITHDDALDVVVEEATEDAQRMGGMAPLEEPYLDVPFTTMWRKRAVWLSCLFVAEFFTFSAMSRYEKVMEEHVVLAMFTVLCISTGGNSGSQAATLITRAMALGHIGVRQWWTVIRHELLMGLALGVSLGIIGFLRVMIPVLTPTSVIGAVDRLTLSFVIGQTVAAICLWGTLVGSILPMIFTKLGFDPGYASSPFVATFVDVTGIVIYFSIAKMYLF